MRKFRHLMPRPLPRSAAAKTRHLPELLGHAVKRVSGILILAGLAWPILLRSATLYLVVGSDTAIWKHGTTVDVYARHPYSPQDFYTDPASPSYQVMDPAWRIKFKDSFGQPVKFTWWMMGGNIYRDAAN